MLRKVQSDEELRDAIVSALSDDQFTTNSTSEGDAAGSSSFTGTYTQDPNVDEFDAVRYDGDYLYVAPQRYLSCCFIFNSAAASTPVDVPAVQRSIRILATDPDNASASLTSEIPLAEDTSVQGMYTTDDALVALTSRTIYGHYGEAWTDIALWHPEQLGLQIYDITDPATPELSFDAQIDGVFVDSRRVGDIVYIISRYAPSIAAVTASQQVAGGDIALETLLPKISINGNETSLIESTQCFVTNDEDPAYPVLTSVTAIPISNPENFATTCYADSAYGVYVSESAIYLTQHRDDPDVNHNLTRIHKFAMNNGPTLYRGSAEIIGRVWRGGQNDFRMSDADGDLRVFASSIEFDSPDRFDHALYILRESTDTLALDVIGELPNSERPEEIGKPNEALYGVRFLGNRAYAVTFEQIDPLYVIDLTDPQDPMIAGALEVEGFSDFLHPVGDDLLLGLGQSLNGSVKLELFDVSDIERPLTRGATTIGGPGSYSEARHDRHAFTYQGDVAGVDRFTIPVDVFSEDGGFVFVGSGLYLFEIRDKQTPNLASLAAVGSIDIVGPGGGIPTEAYERNRAFIDGDTVYYVRDSEVWSAFWSAPSTPAGPF
ncbi:MAG: beta-propeller domain-containing protein [Pseudomonadota bacterium]